MKRPRGFSKPSAFKANKIHITGGQFNQVHGNSTVNNDNRTNIFAAKKGGFERLQEAVATGAFHNSAQRVDAPKCHPNTRIAVMERIMAWTMSRDDRAAWIMWLSGAAGAGKSAIAQSIAELCVKHGIPIVSFFFFRTDPARNNIHPLVATLAYQLILIIPSTRNIIVRVISRDPLIFNRTLEDQLELLILNPLRQIGRLYLKRESTEVQPLLVLIDGLDECGNRSVQTNLIRTLSNISANRDLALTFLITSRPESHLKMGFSAKNITNVLTCLALDNTFLPDDDIRLFLNDKFAEIRDIHPLKHLLDPSWPSRYIVDDIIKKSSGQFIFAAVVMNYVSSPRGHPSQLLEVCRGLRPAHADAPFAQLDALYRHIFSEVQDMNATRPVLAMTLYGTSKYFLTRSVDNPFLCRQETGSLENCLSDLSSVISCRGNDVNYLHASLPDFLCDPKRSGEYYMDPGIWHAYLALLLFQDIKYCQCHNSLVSADLLCRANPIPELQSKLVEFEPMIYVERFVVPIRIAILGLSSAVKAMNFNDGGKTYRRFFSRLAPYVKTHYPDIYPDLTYLAPVVPTLRSRFNSIFPVAMKTWLSPRVGAKKLEKTKTWGIVEHENYLTKLGYKKKGPISRSLRIRVST